jgi:alpha-L-fucosidase 2
MKNRNNILKFETPAKSARGALPSGNGNLGVLVYGGAGRERIVVNDARLFWQGRTGVLPDVSEKVKLLKKKILASNFRDAECVLTDALVAKNYKSEPQFPLPVCDFVVSSNVSSDIEEYYRAVDMFSSEVEVSFRDKDGRTVRDIFVDNATDTICYKIFGTNGKKVNVDFTVTLHDKMFNRLASGGTFSVDIPFETHTDRDFVVFSARSDNGTDFGCVAKVLAFGGDMDKTADTITVKCAEKVVVLAKVFVNKDKTEEVPKIMEELSLQKTPYEKLLKENSINFAKNMTRMQFDLENDEEKTVEEELLACKTGKMSKNFFVKLYNYGKYLFETSSSALNLCPCGLVNGDYKAYQSTTNNFVQLSRLFNFTFKSNLYEQTRAMFDRFYEFLDDYKKNSTRIFGCRGIFIPSLEAPESGLLGSITPDVILNTNVGAQVASMIFKYYLVSGDVGYIREKGFEIIEQVGLFYEEFLVENKNTQKLESPFGVSPYSSANNFKSKSGDVHICSNALVDFASAKMVFRILNQLCVVLNKGDEEIARWEELSLKIPDVEVDKNGIIKEYNSNIFETDNASPYIPHLFPYNIGFKPSQTRREFETLVANTIRHRYAHAVGKFSSAELVDMALALATCGEGADSFEVLETAIKNFLGANLVFNTDDIANMGVGRPSQFSSANIDKNTALCACVQNMFVSSSKNNIYLFQNLPRNFGKGSINGLTLDYEIACDCEFNIRRGILKLHLKSPRNTTVNLFLPRGFKKVKGTDVLVDKQNMALNGLPLPANKFVKLKIYFSNL